MLPGFAAVSAVPAAAQRGPMQRVVEGTVENKEGVIGARVVSTEDYIARSSPFMEKEGFFEREIARRADVYGSIAQVFSTYESLHKKDDKTPFARGINSFQLLNDGTRWWVVTIYWQGETPENLIPKDYLKSKKD